MKKLFIVEEYINFLGGEGLMTGTLVCTGK